MEDLYNIAKTTAESLTFEGWALDREFRNGEILPRLKHGNLEILYDPEDLFISLNEFNNGQVRWNDEDCRNLGKEVVKAIFRKNVAEAINSHAVSSEVHHYSEEEVDAWFEYTIEKNKDEIIRIANERSNSHNLIQNEDTDN